MIYFDAQTQTWKQNKYKIIERVTSYGDFLDGYSEDAEVSEVTLTPEQQTRLEEIQGIQFQEMDAIAYVRDGIGSIPDNRTNEEKLVDIILEVAPEKIDSEEVKSAIPGWTVGERYKPNQYVLYEGNIYRIIQPHTSQADWPPSAVPALYHRLGTPTDEGTIPDILDWIQPTGGHDAYQIGDKVKYNGKVYESLIDGNVWSPDAYPAGWKEVV